MSRAIARVVLLAGVFAGPDPATAQNGTALVSAETLCRAAPSPSADAVGILDTGDVVLFFQGVYAATGQWTRVTPSRPGHGVSGGCWVPSSEVAPARGTGRFLQLADRLLSATVGPTLDELLAVHNLFAHPWHREEVEASAVLSERRRGLLARAVKVAQRQQLDGRRPVDEPLVLAWIESLGEQVTYSEGGSGDGSWTMAVTAYEPESEPPRSQPVERATRPERGEMAVIAPDVACRSRPSRTAYSYSHVLPLDFHFLTDRADTSVAGGAWVHVGRWGCWVLGEHTAPGDSEEHVMAMTRRLLTSGEGWSSENRLRLYNALSSWNRGHREEVEASPVLGLARLRVLEVALDELRARASGVRTDAWIAALGDEVTLTDEGHSWTVSDEAYLSLYEQHRADPFAEEILWTFASESAGYDCEGGFACSVRGAVVERLARYWTDFPNGRHIAEAVAHGRTVLDHGLESCNAARGADPDSPEAGMWEWSGWDRSGAEITRELLATLSEVNDEDKAPLLGILAELEACAA